MHVPCNASTKLPNNVVINHTVTCKMKEIHFTRMCSIYQATKPNAHTLMTNSIITCRTWQMLYFTGHNINNDTQQGVEANYDYKMKGIYN